MAAPGDLTDNVCPEMEGTRTPAGPCVTEGSVLLKESDLSDVKNMASHQARPATPLRASR